MRLMRKNMRLIHYATPLGEEPIKDEWGNDTLEVETIYSEPTEFRVNYSAAAGEEYTNVFGDATEYSRVLAFTSNNCPLVEGSLVWIGVDSKLCEANYVAVKVADSLNYTLVAVRERS